MNILSFGASYSKKSINKQFAHYTANLFEGHIISILDLNDFQLPIFTVDIENEIGHPIIINEFIKKIEWANFIIISMAEHNGNQTASFKNLFDWTSRVKMNMFENKKILLLSTSTGERGGLSSLETALNRFPRHGAEIIGNFSLPKFNENFSFENGIINEDLNKKYRNIIVEVKSKII